MRPLKCVSKEVELNVDVTGVSGTLYLYAYAVPCMHTTNGPLAFCRYCTTHRRSQRTTIRPVSIVNQLNLANILSLAIVISICTLQEAELNLSASLLGKEY